MIVRIYLSEPVLDDSGILKSTLELRSTEYGKIPIYWIADKDAGPVMLSPEQVRNYYYLADNGDFIKILKAERVDE